MRPCRGRCPGRAAASWSGTASSPGSGRGPSAVFRIRPSVCFCKATRPRSPRSSTMNLNPPAVPRPGIADAPSTVNWASGTFSAQALLRLFMIAVSRSSGFCRLSKGARTMNIEAKLELFACNRNELPAKATVCACHAGRIAWRDLFNLGDDRFGPLQGRRVGQLDVRDQPALVLLRNESGRRPLKHPSRSVPANRRRPLRRRC